MILAALSGIHRNGCPDSVSEFTPMLWLDERKRLLEPAGEVIEEAHLGDDRAVRERLLLPAIRMCPLPKVIAEAHWASSRAAPWSGWVLENCLVAPSR